MNRLSMMGELAASLAHEITQGSRRRAQERSVRPAIFWIRSLRTWARSGKRSTVPWATPTAPDIVRRPDA